MRTVVFGICIFISSLVYAQRECATASYIEQQKTLDPRLSSKLDAAEAFINFRSAARLNGEDGIPVAGVIRIPVVVHILYNHPSQNIPDAQVQSQIDAMNRDFRRMNADTMQTPQHFRQLAADVQIEFALATADPFGRPTSGIVRKATSVSYWKTDDKIKFTAQGGDDAWDSRHYLNIWVGNLQSAIGYSSLPGGPAEKDGIVAATSVFGTVNAGGVYNLGRTIVHEAGHWLGLKHIWGDHYCGDDGVDDTPKQGNFTAGCPSGFRTSCDNSSTGDMYMNYMDYTADACMNLFTEGQKQRMRFSFHDMGPRNTLLYSKGLSEPWMAPLPVQETTKNARRIFPNPATDGVTLSISEAWIGRSVRIISMNGTVLRTIVVTSANQGIDVSFLKPGMYLLLGETEQEKLSEKLIRR